MPPLYPPPPPPSPDVQAPNATMPSPRTAALAGVKDGILLELGFDDTAPNRPVTISSWAWDTARERGVSAFDNRAAGVLCYAPTHTFVEKLRSGHGIPHLRVPARGVLRYQRGQMQPQAQGHNR